MSIATQETEALVDRLFAASVETCDVLTVYLGDRLGLYRALAGSPPLTAADLGSRARIHPRYAREWLEQQAVTGILQVDDPSAHHDDRRYSLPPAHAHALADPDSPWSITPLGRFLVACAKAMPDLLEAYRTGGGVSWQQFGDDAIDAQGDFNRPWLMSDFGSVHLPAVTDVHERLSSGARVADIACGYGWSAIAVARAYPRATVDGYDVDAVSIRRAAELAAQHGVGDRVSFHLEDAGRVHRAGVYDLAIMIEALHDVARPVEVLASIREMLVVDGCALIADEKTAEEFAPRGPASERLFYGFSTLSCLSASMAEQPSAATGAVMRPDTLRRYAEQAGFRSTTVVDEIDHPLLRFYRLSP